MTEKITLHLQAEQYMMEQIKSGRWSVGEQIPTEAELSTLLGISRPTVRQALEKLTARGYLVRIKRKGTFVQEPKLLHQSTSILSSYRRESAEHGLDISTEVLEQTVCRPPQEIAEHLSLSGRQTVNLLVRRRCVSGYNAGLPVVYSKVYMPTSFFPEMQEIDFTVCSLYDTLNQHGRSVTFTEKTLEVIMPPADIQACLKIGKFEPVILIKTTGYTAGNKAVEYSMNYYPAGCSQFLITARRYNSERGDII